MADAIQAGSVLQLTAVIDDNLCVRLTTRRSLSLDLLYHFHSRYDLPEHHVLAIQPEAEEDK